MSILGKIKTKAGNLKETKKGKIRKILQKSVN